MQPRNAQNGLFILLGSLAAARRQLAFNRFFLASFFDEAFLNSLLAALLVEVGLVWSGKRSAFEPGIALVLVAEAIVAATSSALALWAAASAISTLGASASLGAATSLAGVVTRQLDHVV